MNLRIRSMVASAVLAVLAVPASATALVTLPAATGALASPDGLSFSFNADPGVGALTFQLQGFATLDGDHFWIDLLHVVLNGSEIFLATYDLGGGGVDRELANPGGGTAVKDSLAHTVDIDLPLSLLSGSNTLQISYTSPTTFEGSGRAGPQGLGDEGWGLNALTVTGSPFTGQLPEPTTLALAGLGLLAGGRRLRRRAAQAT